MRPGEGEGGHAVIEHVIRTAGRVAGQAGGAVVGIPRHAIVFIVRLRVGMAGGAGELGVIRRIGMTIHTSIPLSIMFATEDREVLPVVIKGGGHPTGFAVTGCTILGEHQGSMIRIGGLVIVGLVAAGAGARGIEIIPVVAGGAIVGNEGMRPVQWIEIIVVREEGRIPVGVRGMAGRTIHGESQVDVVGVDRLVEVLGVARRTFRGGAGIAGGMAGCAIDHQVAAGQREGGHAVIEHIVSIPGGMAGQTGRARIGIAGDPCMVIIRFRIHVTGDAGEFRIISRVGMALGTGRPFALVLAGVDREVGRIVVLVGCRSPSRIGGVAGGTVGGESTLDVVGIQGGLEIGGMTRDAIRRRILVGSVGVALGAIRDGMTQGQGEEAVVHLVRIPVDLVNVMAIRTIGGEVVLDVVGAGGGLEVLQVAVDTVVAQAIEAQAGLRLVTVETAHGGMCAHQGKTIIEVDLGHIIHQPVVGRVTTGTILANGLLVDVHMA